MSGLPKAILVDIDGTVALRGDRGPFDWKRVGEDKPNAAVIEVVQAMQSAGYRVIFLSGRSAECRKETVKWLMVNVTYYHSGIFMRLENDYRKDSVVKRELYERHIRPHFDVVAVFDDRNQVVEMWRDLGLTCLQVAPGDF